MADPFETAMDALGIGVAFADAEIFEITYANAAFDAWFADGEDGARTLPQLFPDLSPDDLRGLAAAGRPLTITTERRFGRRRATFSVAVAHQAQGGGGRLVVECRDITQTRRLELMLESYSAMVEKQNRSLRKEKERVEKLLLNVMPRSVCQELQAFGVTAPQKHDCASVLLLDFIGYTDMAISNDPAGVIGELNEIFTAFDQIADQFGCERIKTIGDAYMAVSGVPEATPDHARNIARAALLMVRHLERRSRSRKHQWQCRVGINSGPVIGSIVGVQKYVYDIFGPGVNLAARMEAYSEPMEITLCDAMLALIEKDVIVRDRGVQTVKGYGERRICTLLDMIERPEAADDAGAAMAAEARI